jgi:hypothetical protein
MVDGSHGQSWDVLPVLQEAKDFRPFRFAFDGLNQRKSVKAIGVALTFRLLDEV